MELCKKNKAMRKKYAEQECELESCNNMFIPYRKGVKYCSTKCSSIIFSEQLKKERILYNQEKKKKIPIPKKFLVRGRIHGVDY